MKAFFLGRLLTYIVEELKLGRAIHLYAEFSRKLAFLPFSYLDAAGLSLQ